MTRTATISEEERGVAAGDDSVAVAVSDADSDDDNGDTVGVKGQRRALMRTLMQSCGCSAVVPADAASVLLRNTSASLLLLSFRL